MTRSIHLLCVVVILCATMFAQAPESQLPDAPQQQPQDKTQPPPAPPDEPPPPAKQPESKAKRTLKRGAPNCIHIGGLEKCKASGPGDDEDQAGETSPSQQPQVPKNQPLPRSVNPEESSSKESEVSLGPMPGSDATADVKELRPYDPHKADRNVEVGDFYFKRGNYRAAESRYAEALLYMSNHAVATYKLAEAQDKLGKFALARVNYQKYLEILPKGEYADLATKALARLDARARETQPTSPPVQKRR